MTNQIDVLRQTLEIYTRASQYEKVMQELLDHLTNSVMYVEKYAEKNNVSLPNIEQVRSTITKAMELVESADWHNKAVGAEIKRLKDKI